MPVIQPELIFQPTEVGRDLVSAVKRQSRVVFDSARHDSDQKDSPNYPAVGALVAI
ncbi:Uncharacterised protein [Vibrio cholerae]|nr:Uncharacterised protein [Vibrio cholerae]